MCNVAHLFVLHKVLMNLKILHIIFSSITSSYYIRSLYKSRNGFFSVFITFVLRILLVTSEFML